MEMNIKRTILILAILLASVTAYAEDATPKPAVAPVSAFSSDKDFCGATFKVSEETDGWADTLRGVAIVDLGGGVFKKKSYPSVVNFLQDMKASGWSLFSMSAVSSIHGGGVYQEIFLFTKSLSPNP